jgi:uncharacterized protein YbjT (DUF2867 family)
MRVLLLGATGLIGRAALTRLIADGREVVGLARDVRGIAHELPQVRFLACDLGRMTAAEAWIDLVAGVDAVVNAAGQLQDGGGDDVEAVQERAVVALGEACARRGVRRFVQVSAVGATEDAPTAFMRTKARADARLAALGLDLVVLRPGLVLAAQAHGGTALIRALAALPFATPIPAGAGPIQTVAVEEVAEAIARGVAGTLPPGGYDLVAPERHALADVVGAHRRWLGHAPARALEVPMALVRLVAAGADALGRLGWRSPFRSTAVAQIAAGVVGDGAAWAKAAGRAPEGLAATLARRPATVQERWFARLYLLKAVAIGTLALFWVVSGLVALSDVRRAAEVLTMRGWGLAPAGFAVVGGALADVALGLAISVRRFLRPAALGMIALSLAYLGLGTFAAPDLWLDPLGPFLKVLPGLVLALVVLAIEPGR